eukprot:gnl/TRDRNA2_/TRDRNA2_161843_c0_seq1.p1 gnl/TRDRNA2_/TRDRNA2_161843_c0~~gnl/TRDRNA2_/TRDRNA2_161843_c0_seq1.p1  ORF type:complete len:395 (+),score=65.03 gnl/TRDRNA2_/TRDRNA2_161843_c0_seq1:162-1346(+)
MQEEVNGKSATAAQGQMQIPPNGEQEIDGNRQALTQLQMRSASSLPSNGREVEGPPGPPWKQYQPSLASSNTTLVTAIDIAEQTSLLRKLRSDFEKFKVSAAEDLVRVAKGQVRDESQLLTYQSRQRASEKNLTSQRSSDLQARALQEQSAYRMKENVWDSIFFVGHPAVGFEASCILVFGGLGNATMQLMLCWLVAAWFVDSPYTDQLALDMERWRALEGNTTFGWGGSEGNRTVASRVCSNDPILSVAKSQTSMREELEHYMYGDPWMRGPILCVLVLTVWSLTVADEMRGIVQFLAAVWKLPRDLETKIDMGMNEFRVESATLNRGALALGIALLQFGISSILLFFGSIWLINTISIQELLLNASALSFIMNLDELFFQGVRACEGRRTAD